MHVLICKLSCTCLTYCASCVTNANLCPTCVHCSVKSGDLFFFAFCVFEFHNLIFFFVWYFTCDTLDVEISVSSTVVSDSLVSHLQQCDREIERETAVQLVKMFIVALLNLMLSELFHSIPLEASAFVLQHCSENHGIYMFFLIS